MTGAPQNRFGRERTDHTEAWLDAAIRAVRQTVKAFRARGAKSPYAIEQAALALNLSRNRARDLFYGEYRVSVRRAEYVAIMRARVAHLHREAAELERLTAELRNIARQAELKLADDEAAKGPGWRGYGVGWPRSAPGVGVVR